MKTFKELRENKGQSVYKKKHGKYPVEIKKDMIAKFSEVGFALLNILMLRKHANVLI